MNKKLFIPATLLTLTLVSPVWAKDEHRDGHDRHATDRYHDTRDRHDSHQYSSFNNHGRTHYSRYYPGHRGSLHRDQFAGARHEGRHKKRAHDAYYGRRHFLLGRDRRYNQAPRWHHLEKNHYDRPLGTQYYRGSAYQRSSGDAYRQIAAEILTNELIIHSRR